MNITVITIVTLYLLFMIGVGFYSSRKIKSNEDFMVAGRRLGPWLMAGTLAATEVGGGSSLGVVEMAYGDWGMSSIWYVLAMAVTFVILSIIAPRLRNAMVKTVPEYMRRRYGEAPGALSTLIMLPPMIGLTAAQIIASSVVFSVMTQLPYETSVIIVTLIVTAYSVMGGLWSITLTDFVQMFFIVFGMALVVPFALNAAGGYEFVISNAPVGSLSFIDGIGWKTVVSLVIMYTASFAVGQEAVQRFYAAKDGKSARHGAYIACGVYIIFAFIPAFTGIIARVMVDSGIIDATQIMANGARYALPTLAIQTMPSVLVGILFAGLISATMSSADSNMLAAGSIFANDVYRPYINKDADDKKVLRITQLTMIAVGLMSMLVAIYNTSGIINILVFSFALRAGGTFIPYVLGHYWRQAGGKAAVASIIIGSGTMLLTQYGFISFFGMDPVVPALIASGLVYCLVVKMMPVVNGTLELRDETDKPALSVQAKASH